MAKGKFKEEKEEGESSEYAVRYSKKLPRHGKYPAKDLTQVDSNATVASKDKIDLVHLEEVLEDRPKPTKKQKFRRHCARFWCCYVLALIILLAIGLPVLFLVIVPALAQRIIDDTNLPIYGGSLLALNNDQVKIGLSTSLKVPGGLSVKLDPLELWLFNRETPDFQPWSMVPLESVTAKGRTEINVEEQIVGVGNRSELNTWLTSMLYNKKTDISARGNTTAHLGALSFKVRLDKTISIDALRTLDGFALESARVKLPPEDDGSNVIGELTLPNWSDLNIGLGNLTFNVWADKLLIGSASVFDVILPPGNTTMPFRGEIFLPVLFDNLIDILGSQAEALGKGVLAVGVSGNKTLVDGEHITYLENVLNEANIKSEIPIVQLLTDILRSVASGDVELGGLLDVISDGVGPLLDDLLGGLGAGDDEGEEGEEGEGEDQGAGGEEGGEDSPDLIDLLDGGLLDNWDDEGNSTESDSPLLDVLDGLGMKNTAAKRRVVLAVRNATP